MATYQAAANDEERSAVLKNRPLPDNEIERLNRLIDLYTDAAPTIDAIGKLMAFNGLHAKYIDVLVDHHAESSKLGDLSLQAIYAPGTTPLLKAILDHSPHTDVKGKAAFARANQLSNAQNSDKDEKRIEALANQTIELLGEKHQIAAMAKGLVFELKNLSIGKKAPEIVGKDLEDVEFQLSDYAGKVVILDFWGDW